MGYVKKIVLTTNCNIFTSIEKKVRDKSRECHSQVLGVPQSQAAVHHRHDEEEETDKTKQAQIEQTYEKRTKISSLSSPSEVIVMLKGLKNTRTK